MNANAETRLDRVAAAGYRKLVGRPNDHDQAVSEATHAHAQALQMSKDADAHRPNTNPGFRP